MNCSCLTSVVSLATAVKQRRPRDPGLHPPLAHHAVLKDCKEIIVAAGQRNDTLLQCLARDEVG